MSYFLSAQSRIDRRLRLFKKIGRKCKSLEKWRNSLWRGRVRRFRHKHDSRLIPNMRTETEREMRIFITDTEILTPPRYCSAFRRNNSADARFHWSKQIFFQLFFKKLLKKIC